MEMIQIKHHHFETLDSTQEYAKREIPYYEKNRLYLFSSDIQTKGRGTQGKTWFSSDKENIYATFAFFLTNASSILEIPKLLIYAIFKALSPYQLDIKIKWPNDLMYHDQKFCGILTETFSKEGSVGSIVGFGINVNMNFFPLLDQPVTSLYAMVGKKINKMDLLDSISYHFRFHLRYFENNNIDYLTQFFNTKMSYLGYEVYHEKKHLGISYKMTDDGKLVVQKKDGSFFTINYGSIKIHD